jgi:hypothetical protein
MENFTTETTPLAQSAEIVMTHTYPLARPPSRDCVINAVSNAIWLC